MIGEARRPAQFQRVRPEFLDAARTITHQELSPPTSDPTNPTLHHWLDQLHWHFAAHLRQVIPTRKNLKPQYYARRSLCLPELASFVGPLAAESAIITPYVLARKPAPEKMGVKGNLERLVKAGRDCIVPGLTQALERIRSS